jgi:hypothetical protein
MLLHSHNSVLDYGILYSGIFCECFVCRWEWLLSTRPKVFAMTCVWGGTVARNLWGSWTAVSAVLWQSFLVQLWMWRLYEAWIISGGLFINETSNTVICSWPQSLGAAIIFHTFSNRRCRNIAPVSFYNKFLVFPSNTPALLIYSL